MAWYHRLFNLTRSEALSSDVDREMAFHIDERVDALVAEGMSEDDARREARRRFGHVQQQKELTRGVDVAVWLESLGADIRYAGRSLKLSPGFTLVAVLSIALGVGANTAIFSLINAVMLRSLPVPHAEELVKLSRGNGGTELTNPLWEQIRDHQDAVDAFAYSTTSFNLATGGEARRVDGSWVTGSYFPVLGARPLAGRLLVRSDDTRGCAALAVVSPGFASREHGAPNDALGRSVSLDGHPFEIVGVTEPSFFGVDVGSRIDVFVPLCAMAIVTGDPKGLDEPLNWFLQLMGRPRNHYPLEQVNARLAAASAAINMGAIPGVLPDIPNFKNEWMKSTISAQPASTGYSTVRARYSEALVALMVVVSVVLLIACANVAHLLLARAATRQREMALRLALGAGRFRLIRQLLTESLLLALLGSALGIVFARWAGSFLVQLLYNPNNRVWLELGLDLRVLGFTIAVAALTGILFGLAPAWRATRVAPQSSLQAHGRGAGTGSNRLAITKGLVVGQVALSLLLLVAAGLLLRSFEKLAAIDPGFKQSGVLLATIDVANAGYPEPQRIEVYRQLLERLRALPGVRAASASRITPISGSGWNGEVVADGFTPKSDRDGIAWFNGVSDGFFATMGTKRIVGRDFTAGDVANGAPVAIVNASLAKKVWGNANPVGKLFRHRGGEGLGPLIEVVGVVEDAKYRALRDSNNATVYVPLVQAEHWGSSLNFSLRTDGDPTALQPAVRAAAREMSPAISLDFVTLSQQVAFSLARPRLLATLSAFFGALALLLAMMGLYGTVAYSVARRRNEIGIRLALGATSSRVVRMVLGEVSGLTIIGAVFGVLLAIASTRFLRSFLYGLTATDPTTLALSVSALAAVAIAAGVVPAWRAARLDPMETLREE